MPLPLLPRRLRISPASDFRIRQLLVVSGPSGSGKSTFLRQLAAGRLSSAVMAALPPRAGDWPQTNGFGIRGRACLLTDAQGRRTVEGVVLHYDIMRVVDTLIGDYGEDPTLLGLELADMISAVVVRVSPDGLVRQLGRKRPHSRGIGAMLKGLERRVRSALRPERRAVYHEAASAGRRERLARLYVESDFLDRRYRVWEAFLKGVAGSRMGSPVVYVEPVAIGDEPVFRLTNDAPLG